MTNRGLKLFALSLVAVSLSISGGLYAKTTMQTYAGTYSSLKNWSEVSAVDERVQSQFVERLNKLGRKVILIPFKTPTGNVVSLLGGQALPLSGLVVTHSMDGDLARNNDVIAYLRHGYNSIGVDKLGRIFIRGSAFLRTKEGFVPNHSTINLTFDVNAERGELMTSPQVAAAADIAESLQLALDTEGTGVQVQFKDHHDPGFKPGKKFLEAGPARDAANKRLLQLRNAKSRS